MVIVSITHNGSLFEVVLVLLFVLGLGAKEFSNLSTALLKRTD